MAMRVDIQPQWRKLAKWYWEEFDQPAGDHMSIWDMLENDYGALKGFKLNLGVNSSTMWVVFPDEKSYVAFLLRWS